MKEIRELLEKWRSLEYDNRYQPISYNQGYNRAMVDCANELESLLYIMEADEALNTLNQKMNGTSGPKANL